jgi:hypothetical protein
MKNIKIKYNKIICVLDRSGSMSSILDDAIGGLNTFIEQQKELDSNNKISIILFDTSHELHHDNILLSEVPKFDKKTYVPRYGTALYDSIGLSLDNEFDLLASLSKEERSEKTLVFILTDGDENSSIHYTKDQIFERINELKEKFNWEFIFAGANIDSYKVGSSLGITNNIQYTTDGSGDNISVAYASASNTASVYFASTEK